MARQYRRNTKKSSKTGNKKFSKKVLNLIEEQKEMKVAIHEVSDGYIADVIESGDLKQLQPIIPQGTDSNQRVGDSIRLKKVVIRGYYRTTTPGFTTNAANSRIQLRQFIMSQRGVNAATLFDTPATFDQNNFLENSGPYTGAVLDFITPVNQTAFSVKRQRRMTLYQPSLVSLAAGQTSTAGIGLNNSIKYFNHEWNCNQLLRYKTGGANRSDDWKYFLAQAVTMPDGANDDLATRLTYNVTFYYTDA